MAVPDVTCCICFSVQEQAPFSVCPNEGHYSCFECAAMFARQHIMDRLDPSVIPCPGASEAEPCNGRIQLKQIRCLDLHRNGSSQSQPGQASDTQQHTAYGSMSLVELYERMLAERSGSAVACPFCNAQVAITKLANVVHCTSCRRSSCREHGAGHDPTIETCSAYRQRCATEDERSANVIKQQSVECMQCGANVHRRAGCNHITCRCGAEFCWECGLEIDHSITEHYHPEGLTSYLLPECRHIHGTPKPMRNWPRWYATYIGGFLGIVAMLPLVIALVIRALVIAASLLPGYFLWRKGQEHAVGAAFQQNVELHAYYGGIYASLWFRPLRWILRRLGMKAKARGFPVSWPKALDHSSGSSRVGFLLYHSVAGAAVAFCAWIAPLTPDFVLGVIIAIRIFADPLNVVRIFAEALPDYEKVEPGVLAGIGRLLSAVCLPVNWLLPALQNCASIGLACGIWVAALYLMRWLLGPSSRTDRDVSQVVQNQLAAGTGLWCCAILAFSCWHRLIQIPGEVVTASEKILFWITSFFPWAGGLAIGGTWAEASMVGGMVYATAFITMAAIAIALAGVLLLTPLIIAHAAITTPAGRRWVDASTRALRSLARQVTSMTAAAWKKLAIVAVLAVICSALVHFSTAQAQSAVATCTGLVDMAPPVLSGGFVYGALSDPWLVPAALVMHQIVWN